MSKARTLADFISDGSEFADGTISVAEVSGAAPLASPTFTGTASGTFSGPLTGNVTGNVTGDLTGDVTGNVTGNLTGNVTGDVAGDIDLSAIAATISDTAVDIFVYDTRKDSDGGAWRKRTQHTSWYNETLNTATRGSRKEFPAVAVIVAESNQVTIYDGDDPDLPMWMVFNTGGNWNHILVSTSGYVTCVAMLNGHLVIGRNLNTGWQLTKTSFVDDSSYGYKNAAHGTSDGVWTGGIVARNGDGSYYDNGVASNILSPYNNDVAMTVLPNAPIDAATGLPVPTIAVATNGGVSVIKDDGTVISTISDTGYKVHNIDLQSNGNLFAVLSNSSNANYAVTWAENYTGISGLSWSTYTNWNSIGGFYYASVYGSNLTYIGGNTGGTINDLSANAIGSFYGLTKTDKNPSDFDAGLVNFISSNYNTGWMNGDIKLATLSDTDATNVTGSELVTNGTFDSGVSGWNTSFGSTITWNSGSQTATVTSNGSNSWNGATQNITGLTVGKTYVLTADIITSNNWGSVNFAAGANSGVKYGSYSSWNGGSTFPLKARAQFTATATSVTVSIDSLNTTNATVTEIDNISVRLAEEDRSVNGNGLQVFGTVTKSAVATGADLVAYGPFTNANYLKQPYNSDLDFGTGDFSISVWVKSTDSVSPFVVRTDGTNPSLIFGMYTTDRVWFKLISTGGTTDRISTAITEADDGNWTHLVALRRGERHELYANGVLKDGYTGANRDLSSYGSGQELYVGWDGTDIQTGPLNGSLALLRISATAPSPEQILKMYNDEKVLFQNGAQATLYGESDAVTALAYDDSTNLLHVGTSAGRSVFQGLRRVDNTTTAVGAAISASNGLVADE